ncbi:hypothetical protein [Marinospirillum sp.]|uniref:hypothetical protein n=1 Tax=Marinospirillum sp. TaxID=2183934 RepID=UPI002870343A|nr:hypothetical protein [Marinospirillum sp.]MDR9468383.1 hypothetical protein [Marinospirillum sp.]
MKHGEYEAAEELAADALEGERNRLLRLMEVGVLKHLQGNYSESNQLLSQADRLAYELYTTSVSDLMTRVGTNATLVTYRSNIYERVYIHYYKTLNYLYLAEEAKNSSEFQKHLDAARIEGRRAQILLDENLFQEGSYEEAEEENQKLLTQMLDLFAALNGEVINPRELIFRDNAFTHYLIGTLYERYDELDNARVSYERSARTYENGYVKQYGLDPGMASQAWFDTARILKTQRDNRWQRIAQEKLTSQQQETLQNWNPGQQAQLLVIQEVGMMSPRGELNLWMRLNTQTNQVVISPVLTGDENQKAYQLAWFHYLYADKGLLDVIERLAVDDYIGLIGRNHEKTIPLGPLRNSLDSLGLTEILAGTGVRLTVPMFYYFDPEIKRTRLQLESGKQVNLLNADNLAGLAMAQHLVDAQSEMNQAMAIESMRLVLCVQTGIPAPMCSLTAAATTSADTRLWVTLPNRIRLTRHLLEPGEYKLELISDANSFDVREQQTLNLEAGDLHIWRTRHFAEDPMSEVPAIVQQARAARMANETLVDNQDKVEEKIKEKSEE